MQPLTGTYIKNAFLVRDRLQYLDKWNCVGILRDVQS